MVKKSFNSDLIDQMKSWTAATSGSEAADGPRYISEHLLPEVPLPKGQRVEIRIVCIHGTENYKQFYFFLSGYCDSN